jgi:hypothetical protein
MISNILITLVHFRAESTPADFARIFGPTRAAHLWVIFQGCGYDLVALYAYLNGRERELFEAHLLAQISEAAT